MADTTTTTTAAHPRSSYGDDDDVAAATSVFVMPEWQPFVSKAAADLLSDSHPTLPSPGPGTLSPPPQPQATRHATGFSGVSTSHSASAYRSSASMTTTAASAATTTTGRKLKASRRLGSSASLVSVNGSTVEQAIESAYKLEVRITPRQHRSLAACLLLPACWCWLSHTLLPCCSPGAMA